jgi:hypothetical protein
MYNGLKSQLNSQGFRRVSGNPNIGSGSLSIANAKPDSGAPTTQLTSGPGLPSETNVGNGNPAAVPASPIQNEATPLPGTANAIPEAPAPSPVPSTPAPIQPMPTATVNAAGQQKSSDIQSALGHTDQKARQAALKGILSKIGRRF